MTEQARAAQAQLETSQQSGNIWSIVVGVLLLLGGLCWVYAEQGAATRWYLYRLIPGSWTVVVCGIVVLGIAVVSFVQSRRGPEAWVADDGVHSRSGFISWNDIARIYTSAVLVSGSDIRSLNIVGRDGANVTFSYTFSGEMSEDDAKAFGQLRASILDRVSERLWTEFVTALETRKPVELLPELSVALDGVFVRQELIPWILIRRYEFENGQLQLIVTDENNAPARKVLGPVAGIPNLHILTHYIDQQLERPENQLDSTARESAA